MTTFVIDTNVLLVASRKASHASEECFGESVKFLLDIKKYSHQVCVDGDGGFGEIIAEYCKKNQPTQGQNVGDQFFQYILQNRQNKRLVKQVKITKSGEKYLDFPEDAELEKFDASDRKFVAVAIASKKNPEIVNAGDSKSWERYKIQLEKYVRLKFLCKHS